MATRARDDDDDDARRARATTGACVDALVVCGLPPNPRAMRRARARGVGTSSNGIASATAATATTTAADARARTVYHAGVLDEWPRASARYPTHLATLALPRGVDAYGDDERADDEHPTRYPTILTDENGDRIYVACVSFVAATPERSLRTMSGETAGTTRARACVCLVSRMPCLDAWMEALEHVFEAYFKKPGGGHLPVLSAVAEMVVDRLMWRRDRAVLFPIGGALVTVPPRGAADHGAREAFADGKEPLMRCLRVRTVFKCVAAIACERRLLLRSKQVSLLVKCAEALRGLAHPLVWRHVYIPCVPFSMVDYLGAPMPFIMGATHDVDVDERALEGVTVVDLDTGSMRDGGEQILLPPESMLRDFIERVRKIIKPGIVDTDELDAALLVNWDTDVNRRVTAVFTDFWYELLQLDSLHRYVVQDASGVAQLKKHEYRLEISRWHGGAFTDQILETNAFLSLLDDASSLSRLGKSEAGDGGGKRRAKFRSTQLTGDSLILPTSVESRSTDSLLIPRLHVLNFDKDQQSAKSLRSLSMYQKTERKSMDSSPLLGGENVDNFNDVSVRDARSSTNSTLKRASWGWLKDRMRRRMGSDALPDERALAKAIQVAENADNAVNFDWYYNTLTPKDAASLADYIRSHRDDWDRLSEDEAIDTVDVPQDLQPSNDDDDIDEATALVYPIFTNHDDVVAAALTEHAATLNYVALLTGVKRHLISGTRRFNIVAIAISAAVLRADAAGDAKSLAHAIRIVRTYQPSNCRTLWLKGAARWDDTNLWYGLFAVNTDVPWLHGTCAETRTSDLVRCFALVGLTSDQSSELLNEITVRFDFEEMRSVEFDVGAGRALSASAYSTISFESWVEKLRESSASHFGANDRALDSYAPVQDCCPSNVIQAQIWDRSAITAMTVQSGVVSSLVALGSGRGDVAFFAPDSGVTTRSQSPHTHTSPLSALTFIPRSAHAFCGRRDGMIETWDSVTGTRISVVPDAHRGETVSFVSPVVNQVISSAPLTASAGNDGTVKLWDARQSDATRAVSVIKGHVGGVTAFATRDARGGAVGSILTGDAAGVVRAWDPRYATAGPVSLAHAHQGRVTYLAPLQRSDSTASAGADGVVRVLRLDGDTGGDIRLSGHLGDVTSLCVLQDETRGREPVGIIASGSSDGELCLWSGGGLVNDVRQPWRCVSKSRAHVGAVTCLTTEGSGRPKRTNSGNAGSSGKGIKDMEMKPLLSASEDCSFACWNLSTARLQGRRSSWSPVAMCAPPLKRSTSALCSVIEVSRNRCIYGDRFGMLSCVALPTPAA